jgi:DNA-binding transcriptional LysR family regulator
MLTFAHVVKLGSFSKAAGRLGSTPSVVSKHIAKLEQEVGAKLLQRSTRSLSLTEAGRAYHEHCARILDEVEAARDALAELHAVPRGVVRVTAGPAIVLRFIVPGLADFHRRYPEVRLEVEASNRVADFLHEGLDIAIRATSSPPSFLVAKKLARLTMVACASPAYLAERGAPKVPEDLPSHDCLTLAVGAKGMAWRFRKGKHKREQPIEPLYRSDSSEPIQLLARNGLGIALLPRFMADEDLESGRLLRVLPGWECEDASDLYAIYAPHRHMPPKIRAFVAFITAQFAGGIA